MLKLIWQMFWVPEKGSHAFAQLGVGLTSALMVAINLDWPYGSKGWVSLTIAFLAGWMGVTVNKKNIAIKPKRMVRKLSK